MFLLLHSEGQRQPRRPKHRSRLRPAAAAAAPSLGRVWAQQQPRRRQASVQSVPSISRGGAKNLSCLRPASAAAATNIGRDGEGLASASAATGSNRAGNKQIPRQPTAVTAVVAATCYFCCRVGCSSNRPPRLRLAICTLFWENKLPVLLFDKFTDNE